MTQTVQRVIASFVFASVCAVAGAQAQSLADVAKAANADKKTQPKTTKVYTNENLRQDITPSPAAPPEGTAADSASATTSAATTPGTDAAPAADGGTRDEKYWHDRITAAREAVDRGESAAKAYQNQINSLITDFINRDDPAQKAVIEKERTKVVAELERTQRDIAAAKKAITTIEDEARKAGVPAGWLR